MGVFGELLSQKDAGYYGEITKRLEQRVRATPTIAANTAQTMQYSAFEKQTLT